MNGLKRANGLWIFEVSMANPNGDPDWESRPRVLPDGKGWITDVSVKRKIRDIFSDHNSKSFQDLAAMLDVDPETLHIFESDRRGSPFDNAYASAEWALDLAKKEPKTFLDMYLDVRLFGTTAIEDRKNKNGHAEAEGEEPARGRKEKKPADTEVTPTRFIRTGVVTISPAISIAPVTLVEATITKKNSLRRSVLEKESSDMAPMGKKFLEHGLYAMQIMVNPHVAHHTRTTQKDIDVLKAVMRHAFPLSASASRPGGSIVTHHIWWAEHENSLGSFNESKFYRALMPQKKGNPDDPSKTIDDYIMPTPQTLAFQVSDLA